MTDAPPEPEFEPEFALEFAARPIPSLTLTGTSTSVGVPVVTCDCRICRSSDPRNRRYRSGVLVRGPEGNFVIDASPELRLQLVRERVERVEAAIFTHSHADHIMGLDDLRLFGHKQDQEIDLYCEPAVEAALRQTFHYAFAAADASHKFALPRFEFRSIAHAGDFEDPEPFELCGLTVKPLRLMHGRLPILGYRVGGVAFCTDVSEIPPQTEEHLRGLDALVVGMLRTAPHPTHFNLDQALAVAERLAPRQTYFTHVSHEFDYAETNERLPAGVDLAHDGLVIPISL